MMAVNQLHHDLTPVSSCFISQSVFPETLRGYHDGNAADVKALEK